MSWALMFQNRHKREKIIGIHDVGWINQVLIVLDNLNFIYLYGLWSGTFNIVILMDAWINMPLCTTACSKTGMSGNFPRFKEYRLNKSSLKLYVCVMWSETYVFIAILWMFVSYFIALHVDQIQFYTCLWTCKFI
jgi:hypothetical protein